MSGDREGNNQISAPVLAIETACSLKWKTMSFATLTFERKDFNSRENSLTRHGEKKEIKTQSSYFVVSSFISAQNEARLLAETPIGMQTKRVSFLSFFFFCTTVMNASRLERDNIAKSGSISARNLTYPSRRLTGGNVSGMPYHVQQRAKIRRVFHTIKVRKRKMGTERRFLAFPIEIS